MQTILNQLVRQLGAASMQKDFYNIMLLMFVKIISRLGTPQLILNNLDLEIVKPVIARLYNHFIFRIYCPLCYIGDNNKDLLILVIITNVSGY